VLATAEDASTGRAMPDASVIIVNHNGRRYLGQCLSSILREDAAEYEIILVDNASTDGSADYVERSFPTAQVIRSEANLGFGEASNVAARQAKGRYLAFLNQDTSVEPGWLEALIAALEADPRAGLATSKILLMHAPDRINTCGNEVHFTGLTLCRGMGMSRGTHSEVEEVSAVSGAAFVIRRELFRALGGFDEIFFMYMEDTDLSWRARLAGHRCMYVPSSIVYHDYTLRFAANKTFYQERNRYLMLLKALRWRSWAVLVPALLLAEVVTWGFVLLRQPRQLVNKLRVYPWILQHWAAVMDKRRRAQALRKVADRALIGRLAHRLAYEQSESGPLGRLAHVVFDPLFFGLHRLALALIRW
jgi:GT2 family glycosyltransferase